MSESVIVSSKHGREAEESEDDWKDIVKDMEDEIENELPPHMEKKRRLIHTDDVSESTFGMKSEDEKDGMCRTLETLQIKKKLREMFTIPFVQQVDPNGPEVWACLGPHFRDCYQVSSLGRFKVRNGKISVQKPSPNGYIERSLLTTTGNVVNFGAHVIVARVFLANPEGKPLVNHRNGNRSDNTTTNLEWSTYSENNLKRTKPVQKPDYSRRTGQYSGDGSTLIKEWASVDAASTGLGIPKNGIFQVLGGHTRQKSGFVWKYLDEPDFDIQPGELWKTITFNNVL